MDVEGRRVEVEVECAERTIWASPESRQRLHIHGWEKRSWRHLDTCGFTTVITAEVPRVRDEKGQTESEEAIKGLRWLLLHRHDNLEKDAARRLERGLALNEPLQCAYLLKEELGELWEQSGNPPSPCPRGFPARRSK